MKKQVLTALIGMTLSGAVSADVSLIRVTGGLGYAFSNDMSASDVENSLSGQGYDITISSFEDSGLGYNAWLGWQAHQNLILEVGYLDFAERSAKAPNVDAGFGKALVDSLPTSGQGFAVAVRPTVEFVKDWSAYARLGAMHWESNLDVEGYSSSKSGTDLLAGGGVEHRLSQHWLASLGWDSVKMDETRNHLISFNVTYQFGSESKVQANASQVQDELVEEIKAEVTNTGPQVEEVQTSLTSTALYFDTERYSPKYVKTTEIKSIADQLAGDASLIITATTDTDGNDLYNKILAKKRAQFVVNYLTQKGLSESDMEVIVVGEAEGEPKYEQRKVTIELRQ